jgi:hypothetical protein
MNKIIAQTIVTNVWIGYTPNDKRYIEALRVLDLTVAQINRLAAEARKVTVRRDKRFILIAAGTSR